MRTCLISPASSLDHDTGPSHPERPARAQAVWQALAGPAFDALQRRQGAPADTAALCRVHDPAYVDRVLAIRLGPGERRALDPDTQISAGSAAAALDAAGGAIAAVDMVMAGQADAVFVAARPPGHHAEPDRAMGFCLFNNVAIAAHHARARWAMKRVAVVDFDVHHGNGTQAMFAADRDAFFGSSHQSPCYPGTGSADETGIAGNIVNAPLAPGSGSSAFRDAWQQRILPALDAFGPGLIVISAGFDAHRDDPLADLNLVEADFAWVTGEIAKIAHKHSGGRLVSVLEGGYDLDALAASAAAHVHALIDA